MIMANEGDYLFGSALDYEGNDRMSRILVKKSGVANAMP